MKGSVDDTEDDALFTSSTFHASLSFIVMKLHHEIIQRLIFILIMNVMITIIIPFLINFSVQIRQNFLLFVFVSFSI